MGARLVPDNYLATSGRLTAWSIVSLQVQTILTRSLPVNCTEAAREPHLTVFAISQTVSSCRLATTIKIELCKKIF
jgi:hypothetical protein